MIPRLQFLAKLAVLVPVLCAAVNSDQSSLAEERIRLHISAMPITSVAPLYAARNLGYFEEEGLEVEIVSVSGSSASLAALAAGQVDIAFTDIVSIGTAVQQGIDIVIVAFAAKSSEEPSSDTAVVVRSDSPLRRARDLVGKRVAVPTRNTVSWLIVRAWIDQDGGDSSEAIFLEVPFPQMNDAVLSGAVDAGTPVEPFLSGAIEQDNLRVLGWFFSDVQKELPTSHFVATGRLILENPQLIERFSEAYQRGVDWMNANRGTPEWAGVVASYTRLEIPTILKINLPEYPKRLDPDDLGLVLDLMVEYGLLDQAIDPGSLVHETAMGAKSQ